MIFFMVVQVFSNLIPNIQIDSKPDVESVFKQALKIKEGIFTSLIDKKHSFL